MEVLELKQTQRYYHFVVLKGSGKRIGAGFFNRARIKKRKAIALDSGSTMQPLYVTSDYQYYRGSEDYSESGNGLAPFVFEAILFDCPNLDITILGFPFKKLTVDMVRLLVSDFGILAGGNFVKADMASLIRANDEYTDLYFHEDHYFLAGVYLSISGDSFLSTVKMEGDKPLDSDIYKNYFKPKIESNECHLEKCILKGRIDLKPKGESIKVLSTIHMDKFGNYKLYVHSQGKNLASVPSIFEFLDNFGCLVETPNNPTLHIHDDNL